MTALQHRFLLALTFSFSSIASLQGITYAYELSEPKIISYLDERLKIEIPLKGEESYVRLATPSEYLRLRLTPPTSMQFELVIDEDGAAKKAIITSRNAVSNPSFVILLETKLDGKPKFYDIPVMLDPKPIVEDPTPLLVDSSENINDVAQELPLASTEKVLSAKEAKAEKAKLAKAEKEEKARLAKEEKEEKARLAQEAKEEKARLAKEAKEEKAKLIAEAKSKLEKEQSSLDKTTTTKAITKKVARYTLSGKTYGPVEKNKTLWSIAASVGASASNQREMVDAIKIMNPKAFIGSILKEGVVLNIPNLASKHYVDVTEDVIVKNIPNIDPKEENIDLPLDGVNLNTTTDAVYLVSTEAQPLLPNLQKSEISHLDGIAKPFILEEILPFPDSSDANGETLQSNTSQAAPVETAPEQIKPAELTAPPVSTVAPVKVAPKIELPAVEKSFFEVIIDMIMAELVLIASCLLGIILLIAGVIFIKKRRDLKAQNEELAAEIDSFAATANYQNLDLAPANTLIPENKEPTDSQAQTNLDDLSFDFSTHASTTSAKPVGTNSDKLSFELPIAAAPVEANSSGLSFELPMAAAPVETNSDKLSFELPIAAAPVEANSSGLSFELPMAAAPIAANSSGLSFELPMAAAPIAANSSGLSFELPMAAAPIAANSSGLSFELPMAAAPIEANSSGLSFNQPITAAPAAELAKSDEETLDYNLDFDFSDPSKMVTDDSVDYVDSVDIAKLTQEELTEELTNEFTDSLNFDFLNNEDLNNDDLKTELENIKDINTQDINDNAPYTLEDELNFDFSEQIASDTMAEVNLISDSESTLEAEMASLAAIFNEATADEIPQLIAQADDELSFDFSEQIVNNNVDESIDEIASLAAIFDEATADEIPQLLAQADDELSFDFSEQIVTDNVSTVDDSVSEKVEKRVDKIKVEQDFKSLLESELASIKTLQAELDPDFEAETSVAKSDPLDIVDDGNESDAVKLELAEAYLSFDAALAKPLLIEVLNDGSLSQKAKAQALLNKIG